MVYEGFQIYPTRALRKGISPLVMLTTCGSGEHRNAVVLTTRPPSAISLLDPIRSEARSWATSDRIGLQALIPGAS
jgi:hypothetical protein